MNVSRKKRWIHAGSGLAGAAALWVLVAGLLLPIRVDAQGANLLADAAGTVKPADNTVNSGAGETQVDLQALLAMCQKDWRKPWNGTDPAQTSEAADPPQQPQQAFMNLRLLGTAIETGHSMALFQKSDGSTAVCPEGGRIEDGNNRIDVKRIVGRTVTVQCGGQTQTLALPDEPAGAEQPGEVGR